MENKFKFLTKYSLSKKLKNKWFLIANIIVAIIVIGLVNIDSIVSFFGGDFNNDINIKIINNSNYYDEIKLNLDNLSKTITDSKIIIKKEKDIKKIKKGLKDTNDILLVIDNDAKNIFKVEFISDSYVDTIKYSSIVSCLNAAKSNISLKKLNISSEKLNEISKSVEITRTFISEDKSKDEEQSKSILSLLSMIIVLPCFILIVFLVQMIGAEINEEKSTRGMEIIIGNVSSKTHFFSKILASNIFVLFQGLLLLVYSGIGIIIRKIVNPASLNIIKEATSTLNITELVDTLTNSGIIDKLSYIIPLIIILLVLSFLAYSLLAGILASVTTNMENYQQLQTPLMIISVIGYYLIFLSSMFQGSLFIKIVSTVPLISISLAPSLLISGEIGVNIIIIGIILLLIFNYLLIKYGLKVYKVGILNYSEHNLWKKIFKAIKE